MNRKKREQLILSAAVRVFSRQGYNNTSVSEIIDEADVARGTFYLYFKSKTDVFNALIDTFMMEVAQNVSKISVLQNPSINGSLAEKYRWLASDLITTLTRDRWLTKLILVEARSLAAEFEAKLNLFYDQITSTIRHNLDNAIKAKLFRPCATDMVAIALIGSVREFVFHWIAKDSFEMESQIRAFIDYHVFGLQGFMPVAIPVEQAELSPRTNLNFH